MSNWSEETIPVNEKEETEEKWKKKED